MRSDQRVLSDKILFPYFSDGGKWIGKYIESFGMLYVRSLEKISFTDCVKMGYYVESKHRRAAKYIGQILRSDPVYITLLKES